MANIRQQGGCSSLWLWLLAIFVVCTQALPAAEYEYRDLHPVFDLGLSKEVVRDVESRYGTGGEKWVAQPRDSTEDNLWTFQKRLTWNGPCGNATDGAFFVTATNNRIFQFRCSYKITDNAGTMAGNLIVIAANLMDCADRCASSTYWYYNSGAQCRNVELRNNGECRMFNSFSSTTTISLNTQYPNTAWATFVTSLPSVDCNTAETTAFSPLFTPCGTFLAGTVPNPSTYVVAGVTSTYSFSQYSNWATRTPSSTLSQATACTSTYPFNSVCIAS